MEPKTWDEYYQEGMKNYKGQEDCLYSDIIHSSWDTLEKIEVYSCCRLDYTRNKCEGKCSQYIEGTFLNRLKYNWKNIFEIFMLLVVFAIMFKGCTCQPYPF